MGRRDFIRGTEAASGEGRISGEPQLPVAMDCETARAARSDEDGIVLLDVGDQAARWRHGNRFAMPAHEPRVVGGIYIAWAAFNFGLLQFFHRRNRLIILVPAEFSMIEVELRVYRGKRINTFLTSHRSALAPHWQLLELLAVLHLCDRLPERRALVAIRTRSTKGCSDQCRPPRDADRLAIAVERLLRGWQSDGCGPLRT